MRRDTITISLPKAMTRQVDQLCKAEHRTRSELFREALRSYVKDRPWLAKFEARAAKLPVYIPTKQELRAIERGREEMRKGEFVTLDELFKDLEGKRGRAGGKAIARAPEADAARLRAALKQMEGDPLAGDVMRLKGERTFRRRVGSWRIFFDLSPERLLVEVRDIERRTTTTYRKR
jgi:predicted transcriptional regulator/mRNA-degrading endonuclease RelE of RelBE toxin-antitoxin system